MKCTPHSSALFASQNAAGDEDATPQGHDHGASAPDAGATRTDGEGKGEGGSYSEADMVYVPEEDAQRVSLTAAMAAVAEQRGLNGPGDSVSDGSASGSSDSETGAEESGRDGENGSGRKVRSNWSARLCHALQTLLSLAAP
jgi:hypothetical protein